MKLLYIILILLTSTTVYGQELKDLVFKNDISTLFKKKFDFSLLATKTELNKKIDFVIDNIIGKDTNSIHFFTRLDSYNDLLKIRQDYEEIYSIIDTSEINRNLHFIDFNFDGKLDCIYDRLNPADDNLQFIFLFLNKNGEFDELSVPGFFITKYYKKDGNSIFETYRWACCEESFNHYSISELKNNKIIENLHYFILGQLFTSHLNNVNETVTVKTDKYVFSQCNDKSPLTELSNPIIVNKGQRLKVYDSIDETDYSWKLVAVDFKSKISDSQTTKILGWIKVER